VEKVSVSIKMIRISATLLVLSFCLSLNRLVAEEVEELHGSIRSRQHQLYGVGGPHRNLYAGAGAGAGAGADDATEKRRGLAHEFDDLNEDWEWDRALGSHYEDMSMDCIPINTNSKKSKSSKGSKSSKSSFSSKSSKGEHSPAHGHMTKNCFLIKLLISTRFL
jgi:hypothetical protein